MSKADTRFSLRQAKHWAVEAMEAIAVYSPRIEVAGSIRRQRDDVGDIDLVVLDISEENPWVRSQIARVLMELGYAQTKDGERIASFTRAGKCGLDLYFATAETWGITLLIRTGSAAHNVKLTQVAAKCLPVRRLSVARGVLDTAGAVVASRTEDAIFHALGLRWIDPELREAPEYASWVHEEVVS